jgi:hypothetical protein
MNKITNTQTFNWYTFSIPEFSKQCKKKFLSNYKKILFKNFESQFKIEQ